MKFDRKDMVHCENLVRTLKKGKFELNGMEVLAMSEMMKWVNYLYEGISADIKQVETPTQVTNDAPISSGSDISAKSSRKK